MIFPMMGLSSANWLLVFYLHSSICWKATQSNATLATTTASQTLTEVVVINDSTQTVIKHLTSPEYADSNTTNTTSDVHTDRTLQRCKYEHDSSSRISLFSIDKYSLPRHTNVFKIPALEPDQSGCYLTRWDLEGKLLKEDGPEIVLEFLLFCYKQGTRIFFVENEDFIVNTRLEERERIDETKERRSVPQSTFRFYSRYISYFHSQDCSVSFKGVNMFANMTDLRVLSAMGDKAMDFAEIEVAPDLCKAFRNVVALSITGDWSSENYLHHLTRCAGHMDNVVEVVLTNDSLTSFPEVFHAVMPNLRALEIINNNLSSPVDFPWKGGFAHLPRNLSRNFQFNFVYSYENAFDIAPDLFRRVLALDGNQITNLTNFKFHSDFHYISLIETGMKVIGENVFENTPILQFLSLANNKLEDLPENIFSKIPQLKRLDLQNNKLKRLPSNLFKHVLDLETLNLGENSLHVLQEGLFSPLEKLQVLRLHGNDIVTISDAVITPLSIKLKSVELQSNPLSSFPVFVFMMRGLVKINLDNTSIELLDFVDIDSRTSSSYLLEILRNPTTGEFADIQETPETLKAISLKNSRLRSVVLYNATEETLGTFYLLIKHYTFEMQGANLACDCNILNVTHVLSKWKTEGKLIGNMDFLPGWMCAWPEELSDRVVSSLQDEDTYCPLAEDDITAANSSCPELCKCYVRTGVETIIVDCRNVGLTSLPSLVPINTTELWVQNNTLKSLEKFHYLQQIHSFKLTRNNIQEIPEDILANMPSLEMLHLDDNWLTALPSALGHLRHLVDMRLAGNPFRCDCNTFWFKQWLMTHKFIVHDWIDIKCSTEEADGQVLITVSDDQFFCKESASLGQLALPIALPVTFAIILLATLVVAFIHRRTLKVLLYIYTGAHPFDLDHDHSDSLALFDIAICCNVTTRDWVWESIVKPLESVHKFRVFFFSRDAYAGFSIAENVHKCITNSRRLAVVLSQNWQTDEILATSVRESLEKCRKKTVHFMIVLIQGISLKNLKNSSIRHYIQSGRYISTDDKHFMKKLMYEVPHITPTDAKEKSSEKGGKSESMNIPLHDIIVASENQCNLIVEHREKGFKTSQDDPLLVVPDIENTDIYQSQVQHDTSSSCLNKEFIAVNFTMGKNNNENGDVLGEEYNFQVETCDGEDSLSVKENQLNINAQKSIFVWHADEDFQYTFQNVVRPLENLGHKCVLQDRDFALGAAIQENIVNAASCCQRIIFVLSDVTSDNQWFTFAFHVVFSSQLQLGDHRVTLVPRNGLDVSKFAEDVQHVLRTWTLISESDPWFFERLKQFVDFDGKEDLLSCAC